MPKPKFDSDSAFKKIVSKNQESETIEESKDSKDSKPSKKKKATEGTKQMSYYLTPEIIKKLSIASAYSGKTLSNLVQESLENYLDKVIEENK